MLGKDHAAADHSRLMTLFEFLGQHTDRALFLGEACHQGVSGAAGGSSDIRILAGNDPFFRLSGEASQDSLPQPVTRNDSGTQAYFCQPDGRQIVFDVLYLNDSQMIAALSDYHDRFLSADGTANGTPGALNLAVRHQPPDPVAAAQVVPDPVGEAIARLHALGRSLVGLQDPEQVGRTLMQAACAVTGASVASLRRFDTATDIVGPRRFHGPFGSVQPAPALPQATPMISSSGQVMGVLEIWLPESQRIDEFHQQVLDLASAQAADLLERLACDQALEQSRQNLDALVERMRKVDQNRNKFLNILSHELRNPLASIMMSLSLLDHAVPGGSQANKSREILKRQTAHLSNLVDDLLDVTRITNNKVKLKLAPLDLNAIAARVADDYRSQFSQRGIELDVRLDPGPIQICGDATRVIQAIGNLLQNAVKFTNQGGTTWLTTAVEQADAREWAVIRVRDTGVGIRPESIGDLFEPFSQLEIGEDTNRIGLGLGLAIVKGMVELHGGTISVFSEGENRGTEFTIRLPMVDVQPCSLLADAEKGSSEQRSLRILVIDDSRDLADTICSLLEILGHATAAAYSGPDGIALAASFKPDVILCDIGLPEMDGYEVAQKIRGTPELEHIFLIALSGFAQQEDIEHAVRAGFDQHVAKPVNIDVIQGILKADIEASRPI